MSWNAIWNYIYKRVNNYRRVLFVSGPVEAHILEEYSISRDYNFLRDGMLGTLGVGIAQ